MLSTLKPFNIILAADGYKVNHWLMTQKMNIKYSYAVAVPRSESKYSKRIIAAGATFLAHLFATTRLEQWMIDEAEKEAIEQGYEFNRVGWEKILYELDGIIPLRVYGVTEGQAVKPQTPIISLINSVEYYAWLVSYFETLAQNIIAVWSTNASLYRAMRDILGEYCDITETDKTLIDYMMHNFGDRGAWSPHEAPVIAGICHAMLFNGSDCYRANGYIKKLYNTDAAFLSSIEASEHNAIIANSNSETKDDFGGAEMIVERLEEKALKFKETGMGIVALSTPTDTYNDERFVNEYMGTILKDRILNTGGTLVFRTDSGDVTKKPAETARWIVDKFGVDCVRLTTDRGMFKILHKQTKLLQGDGINIDSLPSVLDGWVHEGRFAMDSFVLGSGEGITNYGTRSDFSFSFKVTANYIDGKWVRALKDPITDSSKKSLSGLVYCDMDDTGSIVVKDKMDELKESTIPYFLNNNNWKCYSDSDLKTFIPKFEGVMLLARYSDI